MLLQLEVARRLVAQWQLALEQAAARDRLPEDCPPGIAGSPTPHDGLREMDATVEDGGVTKTISRTDLPPLASADESPPSAAARPDFDTVA